jgi:hypothetical protein
VPRSAEEARPADDRTGDREQQHTARPRRLVHREHEALDRSAIHPAIDDVEIITSRLGARGRLLGGLALVLQDPVRFPLAGTPNAGARRSGGAW